MIELQTFNKEQILVDPIFDQFKDEMTSFYDLEKGDKIVISVSGGGDSMALLFLMESLNEFELIVVHVNHHLRKDSDQDELLVRQICDSFEIIFYSTSLNPNEIKKGESIEQWARTKRYEYLNQIMKQTNSNWIMTAHHGNDQVETVLMNLSRQSGIAGLCGIGKQNGYVLRPFLGFTKRDLTLFVERAQVPYREDSTNSNLSIPRNFIRHKIVKPWEKKVQNLVNSIKGSVDHFSEWKDALDFFIMEMILPKVKQSDNEFHIPLNLIETMPILVKIRLVQILLDRTNHEIWSKHQIKILKSFFHKEEIGNEHILPNGWKILRDRTSIIGKNMKEITKNLHMELLPNNPVDFNHYRYELLLDNQSELDSNQNQEWVDWSLLKNQKLEIRSWTDGDSFQPLGMEGHQKISDFLINEKVDRFSKESQAVMTANDEIIWVCGRRLADWVKLTKNTKETATLNRRQIII